jgi:uncharacterized protein (DUF1697 family)
MTVFVALLRGVNLGKRQVKSADLKTCFESMGFSGVRTLLASGNVLFEAKSDKGLQAKIEKALHEQFGFEVGTVLRTQDELRALIASDPFSGRKEDADTKLYATFLAEPATVALPEAGSIDGAFEVVGTTKREIFLIARRQADGTFSGGQDSVAGLGKKTLWTSRNWNTVVKAAG